MDCFRTWALVALVMVAIPGGTPDLVSAETFSRTTHAGPEVAAQAALTSAQSESPAEGAASADAAPDFVSAPLATAARSVLALQTAATTRTAVAAAADGRRVQISLTNLAPRVGSWYVLRADGSAQTALDLKRSEFHLQLADRGPRLELFQHGVAFDLGGRQTRCALWGPDSRALAEEVATFGTKS